MRRQIQGLKQTSSAAHGAVPDGVFLVRVDKAQFRWHATKPFYLLQLAIEAILQLSYPKQTFRTITFNILKRNRNSKGLTPL